MLWDRYLVLPYPGYLRDIIANLCACAPSARFCFIGGEGCTQDPGPDNLIEVWVSATLAHSCGMLSPPIMSVSLANREDLKDKEDREREEEVYFSERECRLIQVRACGHKPGAGCVGLSLSEDRAL